MFGFVWNPFCAQGKSGGLLDFELNHMTFPCFCGTYVFSLGKFVLFLAVLGVVATFMQVHRILADGEVLSDRFLPLVDHPPVPLRDKPVRDLKLVLCILELAIYSCLLLGAVVHYSMFLFPWLLNKLLLMAATSLLTCWKFFLQKPMTLSTLGLISLLIELHNFLYVLCLFDNMIRKEQIK